MSKWLICFSLICNAISYPVNALKDSNKHPAFYHVIESIAKKQCPILIEIGVREKKDEKTLLLTEWAITHKHCELYLVKSAVKLEIPIEISSNIHFISQESKSFLQHFNKSIDLLYLHDCNALDEIILTYPLLANEGIVMFDGNISNENPALRFLLKEGYKIVLRGEETVLSKVGSDKSKMRFNEIYENAEWATYYYDCSNAYKGSSGFGSIPHNAKPYLHFLKKFLIKNHIKSVVDLGCGDWQLSRQIDWHRIEYLGIDVVPSLIDHHNKYFKASNIHFLEADGAHIELPKADLLICKDVLQHLPLEEIHIFLKQLSKYKYAILVNTVDLDTPLNNNREITVGDFRPLDLTAAPFYLRGEKITNYHCLWGEVKMIFLWTLDNRVK